MIKKIKIVITALVVGIALSACSMQSANSDKLNVKVQVWALQYLVSEIGKENVDVSLAVASGDAHHKEPTQKEIADLASSKLFFYVGFGDVGVEAKELMKSTNDTSGKNVDVASQLEGIAVGEEKDPHVWLSPKQMLKMAEVVKQQLIEKKSDKKADFEKNYEALKTKLTALDQKLTTMFAAKTQKTILVEHAAYGYMARDYQFKQHGLSENHDHDHDHENESGGQSGEHAELSPSQIEHLKEEVTENKLSILFGDSQNQSEETEKVAKELGVKVEKVSTLETLSAEEAKKDYITHIEEIAGKFAQEME